MTNMVQYLRSLLTKRLAEMDERGASAVEYGLLIAGIAVIIILAVFTLGHKISDLFTSTSSKLGTDPTT